MAGHGEKLSRRQEQLISCLLTEPTVQKAADKAGVPYRSAKRWLALPAFQAAYLACRRQLVDHALGLLQTGTGDAVATLQRNLTCGLPAVEVRAADTLLNHATRAVELGDVLAEVRGITARLEGPPRGGSATDGGNGPAAQAGGGSAGGGGKPAAGPPPPGPEPHPE